ncbi:olfactory receptor 145-like [Polypterus senegalus]|uniref:olfactory receptor 145-like n=1 Tax=Polypterus senegalus TaxID=55291 RepID=UPI001964A9E4|nr:olfactory receptor 145-like [Polypterus senegalus]
MNSQGSNIFIDEQNSTFVRPKGFYISGFQSLQHTNYFFMFLSFVYAATLVANVLLMTIIVLGERLHTPKYIAVFALSVVDVCYSSAIIPKCLDTFLFNSNFVFYESCLAQLFFVHSFCGLESFSLAILAYDRLLAICFPLHCNSINTNNRMILIIFVSYMMPFLVVGISVRLIMHLSFCNSVVVNSYFCDHRPVFSNACGDTLPNQIMVYIYTFGIIFLPLVFIIISYMCIILALFRITTADGRWKAFKTCTTHLILVAIFYIPLLVTYIIVLVSFKINTDVRILNTSLSATLPPLLNPIIYTLKTDEITVQIKKLLRKKINP